MKPYPAYRPTGLPWLPKIPAHWEWQLLSQCAKERCVKKEKGKECPVLSLSYGKIIRKSADGGLAPASYDTYQRVEPGNIILRLTDLQNDQVSLRTGLVKEAGIITSAYTCLSSLCNPAYLQYMLYAYDVRKVFYGLGGGVRQSIGYKNIRNMRLPVPPREEQDRIVRFLDKKVAQIDQLIAVKKRQIELMEERKSAIIDSELTSTSSDWETKALKWYVTNNNEVLSETTPDDYSFEYIDIGSVGFRQLKVPPERLVFARAPSRARKIVREGDTILSTVQTYLRAILYIDAQLAGKIVSTGFAVLRPKVGVYPQLLSYALSGSAFIEAVIKKSVGISYPAINDTKLLAIKIKLPRTIEAQKALYARILGLTQSTDEAVDKETRMIRCLQELKARLISDVVTGAVDVRGKEA